MHPRPTRRDDDRRRYPAALGFAFNSEIGIGKQTAVPYEVLPELRTIPVGNWSTLYSAM